MYAADQTNQRTCAPRHSPPSTPTTRTLLYCTRDDRSPRVVRTPCMYAHISQILPRATADNIGVGGVINDARTVRPL